MTQREQRRDDTGAIGVEIRRESIAFDQNPVAARFAWREVTTAVAELKEIPISAAIARAEILEMRKYGALDDEHLPPKVSWQEFDTLGIRYPCGYDPRCFDVFHEIDLLWLCRRIACKQEAHVAAERSSLAARDSPDARSRAEGS